MKQTIVAIIPPITQKGTRTISDKEFLNIAKTNDTLYTLKQFEMLWNNDSIHVNRWFIRFLEVDAKFSLV